MTMSLIRLRGRTGWSAPLLFACNKVKFFRDEAQCGQIRELPMYTWFESYTSRWVSDVTSCLDVGYIICLLAHDRKCNLTFTRPPIIANTELYATVILPFASVFDVYGACDTELQPTSTTHVLVVWGPGGVEINIATRISCDGAVLADVYS